MLSRRSNQVSHEAIDEACDRFRDFLIVNIGRDEEEKTAASKTFAEFLGLGDDQAMHLTEKLQKFVTPDNIVPAFIGVLLGLSLAEIDNHHKDELEQIAGN